jgi:hypothetical protein
VHEYYDRDAALSSVRGDRAAEEADSAAEAN